MTQERPVSLVIVSIESDIVHDIDCTAIINDFTTAKWERLCEFVFDISHLNYSSYNGWLEYITILLFNLVNS